MQPKFPGVPSALLSHPARLAVSLVIGLPVGPKPTGRASKTTVGPGYAEEPMGGAEATLTCANTEVPFLDTWEVSFPRAGGFGRFVSGSVPNVRSSARHLVNV